MASRYEYFKGVNDKINFKIKQFKDLRNKEAEIFAHSHTYNFLFVVKSRLRVRNGPWGINLNEQIHRDVFNLTIEKVKNEYVKI